jgi:hypothetical protein
MMDNTEIDATAKRLRSSLSEAFAPLIDDQEAMKFSRALRGNASERDMGLISVPISVVYSAMLTFHRRSNEDEG